MDISIDDLTISPEGVDSDTLLKEWAWLLPEASTPILLSAMGDVFVQDATGAVHFLDAGDGTLQHVADDMETFESRLEDQAFVVRHFFPGRIVELLEAGRRLGPLEIFSYARPLVLGGQDEADNIEPLDIHVHLSLLGQIHEQVKDLPEGTVIDGIEFEDE